MKTNMPSMNSSARFRSILLFMLTAACVLLSGPGCYQTSSSIEKENTSEFCRDDVDNDGDGLTDCVDTDCRGFDFCKEDGGMYADGGSGDSDGDTDSDTDTDTDTDSDTDTDADTGAKGIYQWHTFYGPTGDEIVIADIITDNDNKIYVAGASYESWEGPSGQSPLQESSGDSLYRDVFILKLDSNGEYEWHTFYNTFAGSTLSGVFEIVLDDKKNIYITGDSYKSWKGPSGQEPLHEFSGYSFNFAGRDAFILKLDQSGKYEWHTFFGVDLSSNIALDSEGDIYIAGGNEGYWEGPSGKEPLHDTADSSGIAILKLDQNGEYIWHAFYAQNAYDFLSMIMDNEDRIYITGKSDQSWQGPSGQSPLHEYSGDAYNDNAFILKLDSDGDYEWHTFLGSSALAHSIALDERSNIYVTGSSSSWQGPSGQGPVHDHIGNNDLFILKLDENGEYEWHTFYGSSDSDSGNSIVLDSENNIYVAGYSRESWKGPSGQNPLNTHSNGSDILIMRLNSDGQYKWHTFYGSSNWEFARNIVLDKRNNIFTTGGSVGGSWQGPSGQSPLHAHSSEGDMGSADVFILKLK